MPHLRFASATFHWRTFSGSQTRPTPIDV